MAELEPRFHTGPHGPGDAVEGVVVATEPLDNLRSLNAYLRYVDKSPSYSNWETFDSAVPLHEGPLAHGQEVPFSFRLPPDALPNWEDERTNDYGVLTWSLMLETDIARGLDRYIIRPIPVDRTGREWTGPAGANQPNTAGAVDDWDVSIEPDNWSPRRGSDVTFTVRIGQPDAKRSMDLGFFLQCGYDVEVKRMRNDGDTDYVRETRWVNLIEQHPPIDPSLPEQSFTVHIPADGPWRYPGKALGFVWKARVGEERRWKRDPYRSAILEVLP